MEMMTDMVGFYFDELNFVDHQKVDFFAVASGSSIL